ncbi:MAG: AAA domain-containing protein [Arachnia sp.]
MDPHRHLIFVQDRASGEFRDTTARIRRLAQVSDRHIEISYGSKAYRYGIQRVRVFTGQPQHVEGTGSVVTVRGDLCPDVVSMTDFGEHTRVFRRSGNGAEHSQLHPTAEIRVLPAVDTQPGPAAALDYWRAIIGELGDSPTARAWSHLTTVHPASALARFLLAPPPTPVKSPLPIFPIPANRNQQTAVANALSSPVSMIEGPPGTGKTQAIVNIIASVLAEGRESVAMVAATNTAVENVAEKLDELGIGFVPAMLGNVENQQRFLQQQTERIGQRSQFLARISQAPPPSPARIRRLLTRLTRRQEWQRERARLSTHRDAFQLEHQHFSRLVPDEIPDALRESRLLRASAPRILGFVAQAPHDHAPWWTRLRRWIQFGPTGQIDLDDPDSLQHLLNAFYEQQIRSLDQQIARLDSKLRNNDPDALGTQLATASMDLLARALAERYHGRSPGPFADGDWRRPRSGFGRAHPVILSTCHSLSRCIPRGRLLDLLIIDEASQVNPLVGALALACARRVVIVGDERQLSHIGEPVPVGLHAPAPEFDQTRHNLMSSFRHRFGAALPTVLLDEHYRCAPSIIEFCNRSFYDGQLIAHTRPTGGQEMLVWQSVPGHHARWPTGGGAINQREIDMVCREVIPELGLQARQVGYIAPYRRQANALAEVVDVAGTGSAAAQTVHKFQGREREVIVMSTVIDDSRDGIRGRRFVDEARLINVAVSRAVEKFVLVTHHSRHPGTHYLADLIDYIDYHHDDSIRPSGIVSIFDLLYQEYDRCLDHLAGRITHISAHRSENIAGTVLHDVLDAHNAALQTEGGTGSPVALATQYRLAHLFGDVSRLTPEQHRFVRHPRASVDFLVYRSVSLTPVLAVEVDGWKNHADNPEQQVRDRLKDQIFAAMEMPLLRLATTGSDEYSRISNALRDAFES